MTTGPRGTIIPSNEELIAQKQFETDQEYELDWWGDCTGPHVDGELYKQRSQYAPNMGISYTAELKIDLAGKSVLDIGGGPVSMLLNAVNAGAMKVIDPCLYPAWIGARYECHGIEYDQSMGEEIEEADWDEVWIYNVLQHTKYPAEVLKRARAAGKTLRIFEWVKTGTSEGHPHDLSTELLEGVLGPGGREIEIDWKNGTVSYVFVGVFGEGAVDTVAEPVQPVIHIDTTDRKRFHIPAVPHTVTNPEFVSCAYTQKVRKLCAMLTGLGHEVYHYGCEGSDVVATEDVSIVTDAFRRDFYPDNEDMSTQFFYDTDDDYHTIFHKRTAAAIEERKGERDFLLCPWGWGTKPVADALGESVLTVESGIGYHDVFANFKVFESYTWMMHVYGRLAMSHGSFYDCVIPNYFDLNEFEYRDRPEKGDYILYLGRIIQWKGIQVAADAAERAGVKLVIAGQGNLTLDTGETVEGDHIEFVGHADVDKRKELLAGARALICPTYYIGPFEGVSIEAMLSGTPVISTDWGAFAENVLHGVTGYRCRTLEQFVWAIRNIDDIEPSACYEWATRNFSMERVALMYEEYFAQLYGLHGVGWPAPNDERTELDWLRRWYP